MHAKLTSPQRNVRFGPRNLKYETVCNRPSFSRSAKRPKCGHGIRVRPAEPCAGLRQHSAASNLRRCGCDFGVRSGTSVDVKKEARITAPLSVRLTNHTLSLFAALSKPHSLPKRFCGCVAGRLRSPSTTTRPAPRCGGGQYAESQSGSVHGSKFRRSGLREPVDRAGLPRGCFA